MRYELKIRISSGHLVAHIRLRCSVCLWAYFFFGDVLVCDNALPATDLVLALVLLSLNRDDALRATDGDVCLLLLLAIKSPPISRNQGIDYDALISESSLHGTETNFPH